MFRYKRDVKRSEYGRRTKEKRKIGYDLNLNLELNLMIIICSIMHLSFFEILSLSEKNADIRKNKGVWALIRIFSEIANGLLLSYPNSVLWHIHGIFLREQAYFTRHPLQVLLTCKNYPGRIVLNSSTKNQQIGSTIYFLRNIRRLRKSCKEVNFGWFSRKLESSLPFFFSKFICPLNLIHWFLINIDWYWKSHQQHLNNI